MHLILSSCDFGNPNSRNCILKNLKKPVEECKVLFFPNEKATPQMIKNQKYYDYMISRGFSRENVHIFDYNHPSEFNNLDIDCIHISGGNTFATLERIKNSKADKMIIEYVRNGATYIGGSAGAHIASKNIEHLLPIDGNQTKIQNFDGLGLFDGILICHYSEERKKYYEEIIKTSKYHIYTLTDDESIVINI